jgi:hypothetical protein
MHVSPPLSPPECYAAFNYPYFCFLVVPISLVFSIYDSTEIAIQKMIEASQSMIKINIQ